jgi:DNA polymerase-3 subunit beta
MDGELLRRMIANAVFAVSTDETRPALGGVLWSIEGGDALMVSTDGHRLAKLRMSGVIENESDGTAEMIIPPKALNQLTRLLAEGKALERLVVGEKYVQISLGDTELFSRLIEGPYPNYEMVMPKDNDKRLVVDRDLLESAVRRVSILSNTQTHQVKFDLEASTAMLSAVSPDLGGEAREQIEVDYDGESMAVAYNAAYLLEILRHLPAGEVQMTLKTSVSAGVLSPVEQAEGEDLTFLLMPLRLNE